MKLILILSFKNRIVSSWFFLVFWTRQSTNEVTVTPQSLWVDDKPFVLFTPVPGTMTMPSAGYVLDPGIDAGHSHLFFGTRWAKSQLRFGMMPWWICNLTNWWFIMLGWFFRPILDLFESVWCHPLDALMIPVVTSVFHIDIAFCRANHQGEQKNTGPLPWEHPIGLAMERSRICWWIVDAGERALGIPSCDLTSDIIGQCAIGRWSIFFRRVIFQFVNGYINYL